MCHFIPCSEKISAKGVAKLYWNNVGKLHGIPSVLISDRDVRFTQPFLARTMEIIGDQHQNGIGISPAKFRTN